MFQAALNNFPVFIGNSHSLPVTSLEDNNKFNVLNLVVEETARKYIWHKTSYKPANYLLHDLLVESDDNFEKSINIEKVDSVFSLSTKKSFNAHGKIGGELLHMVEASISADDTVTVSADFGEINKQQIDIKSLSDQFEKIHVNMDLPIVKTLLNEAESMNAHLCIVTESLSTRNDVVLSSTSKIQEQENLSTNMTVTPKEDESASKSNTMTLKIPSGTVLFYAVCELYIDLEGRIKVNPDQSTSLPGVQAKFNETFLKSEYGLIFNSGNQKHVLKSIIASCKCYENIKSVLNMLQSKEVYFTKDEEYLKPLFDIAGFQIMSDKLVLTTENALYVQIKNYYECLRQLSDISLSLVKCIESSQLDYIQLLLTTLLTPGAGHPTTSDPSVSSMSSQSLAWLQTVGVTFANGQVNLDHEYKDKSCNQHSCNQHNSIQAAMHVIYVLNQLHKKSKSMCVII